VSPEILDCRRLLAWLVRVDTTTDVNSFRLVFHAYARLVHTERTCTHANLAVYSPSVTVFDFELQISALLLSTASISA